MIYRCNFGYRTELACYVTSDRYYVSVIVFNEILNWLKECELEYEEEYINDSAKLWLTDKHTITLFLLKYR